MSAESRAWLRNQCLSAESAAELCAFPLRNAAAVAFWRKWEAARQQRKLAAPVRPAPRGTDADQLSLLDVVDLIEAVDAQPFGRWGSR